MMLIEMMMLMMMMIMMMMMMMATNLIVLTSQLRCCGPEAEPSPPCIAIVIIIIFDCHDHDDHIGEDVDDDEIQNPNFHFLATMIWWMMTKRMVMMMNIISITRHSRCVSHSVKRVKTKQIKGKQKNERECNKKLSNGKKLSFLLIKRYIGTKRSLSDSNLGGPGKDIEPSWKQERMVSL